jgi:hypothetical protein
VIQGNLKKISLSMAMFRQWALENGLNPSETGYARRTPRALWICDSASAKIPALSGATVLKIRTRRHPSMPAGTGPSVRDRRPPLVLP